jgi:hypothetical protein
VNTTDLKDIVTAQVDLRWEDFAQAHPQLAAAVERTVLIDSAVARIADDPAYQAAMQAAAADEATAAAAGQLIDLVDRWVRRLLAL